MKASYTITNRVSAQCLGTYEGNTPAEALDAYVQDGAGQTAAEFAADMGSTMERMFGELDVVEVTSDP